jgi:acyl-CoA thioester hydrolase
MRHEIRIIFGDTDQMGVVYYANYLRFFESARADYWRSLGRTYKDLEEAQVAMPVIEAHCNYRRPSYYEDLLEVDIKVAEMRPASIRFEYTIYRGADVVSEGYTRHAIIGPNGKPRPLPQFMRDLVTERPS